MMPIFTLKIKAIFWILFVCSVSVFFAENDLSIKPFNQNSIQFTPNKGQLINTEKKLCPEILYMGEGAEMDIFLLKNSVSYVLTNINQVSRDTRKKLEELEEDGKIQEEDEGKILDSLLMSSILKIHRVDMGFVGSNPHVTLLNEGELQGHINYYFPHCSDGITQVKQYNKIVYQNMYNGIDVAYYGRKQEGLKFDIIINPEADPNQIKLRYSGAKHIRLNERKDKLTISTSVGTLGEYMPKVYQIIEGKEVVVEAKYILINTAKSDAYDIQFQLGSYDRKHQLIIDPWITYFGGSKFDASYESSITTDLNGNVIFSGQTLSVDFPVSVGAFQGSLATSSGIQKDAFIVKMTEQCIRVFATYIGGSGAEDILSGLSSDANGNIFTTGQTNSDDFPMVDLGNGAYYDNILNGGQSPIITKFDPTGILNWSSYFESSNGSSSDFGSDTYVDEIGNVVVAGTTNSQMFYTNGTVFQANNAGGRDCFISKFNNLGVNEWSTYLGGEENDACYGVIIDKNNNIIVTGETISTNFPTTPGAFQSNLNINATGVAKSDAFIAKIDPFGSLIWSTYFGGTSTDVSWGVASDELENMVICGLTYSADLPISSTALQTTLSPPKTDAYLAKFDKDGNWLWSTFFGGTGSGGDYATGIAVDALNNIVISGDTYSKEIPVTECAYQTKFQGIEHQFIATFNPSGNLICSSYFGDKTDNFFHNETDTRGGGLAVSGINAYLFATTWSGYSATSNAYQSQPSGDWDIALSQVCVFSCGINIPSISVDGNTSICAGESINFNINAIPCDPVYLWEFEGGTPSTSSNQNPIGITYLSPGQFNVKLSVTTLCGKDSIEMIGMINVFDSLKIDNIISDDTICPGDTITLYAEASGANGNYSYEWNPGNLTGQTITVSPTLTTTYSVSVITEIACSSSNEAYPEVFVYSSPTAAFSYLPSAPTLTEEVSFENKSKSANELITYNWLFENITDGTSTEENPKHLFSDTGNFVIQLVIEDENGCRDSIIDSITIKANGNIYIPNSFSPNGDLLNDIFKVYIVNPISFKLIIFNRWGEEIYTSTDNEDGWDGRIRNTQVLAQEGVYVYRVEVIDNLGTLYEKSGSVGLIR